ncbi:MAG: glycosyltransferase [Bacteroidales bacterium]|nr:glycosyltransferase [Bacteroidales bacterium]
MAGETNYFSEITLLTTHYNRSISLERLLMSFEERHIRFKEIVVSDDGSKTEHLKNLELFKEKYGIRLILTEKNKGLANNINKGQQAVKTPFTLYVQEDFIPTERFSQALKDGLTFIKVNDQIDLVRFYAYRKHPYLKPLKNGFSEMEFHFWRPDAYQFNCYSDHPHLRRSSFPDKFGDYIEGIKSDRAEFKMAMSFVQHKGKAIIHDDYRELFIQENSSAEPSQVVRKKMKQQLQLTDSFFIKIIRIIYRNIKFRIEYLFL